MSSANTKTERKKPKLVRDSFTIPKNEYTAIDTLKTRAIAQGHSVKKSELLRAGLLALQAMGDAQFKLAIAAVPQLKTGRPAIEPVASAPAASQQAVRAAKSSTASQAKAARAVPRKNGPAKPAVVARKRPAAAPAPRRTQSGA